MSQAIGIDIGGTKIAAGIVDDDGRISKHDRILSPANNEEAIVDSIIDLAKKLGARNGIEHVGVSAAGYVDRRRSKIYFAPNLAWRNLPLRQRIQDALGVSVAVENDANAAAWGEFRFGAGADADDLLMVTVGTGVGGGIIVDGNLLRGGFGIAAEIGHLEIVPDGEQCGCGNRGCLEAYGSGSALVRTTKVAAKNDPEAAASLIKRAGGNYQDIDGPMITDAARAGGRFAREQLADLGRWLGLGVANIAAVIDPSVVVVGGGVCAAGDLLLDPLRASYRKHLSARAYRPILKVRLAALGNDAGIIGAADLARRFPL